MVPPERPFYSRWSTWLLAGVVVGGAVALPLQLQASADGNEDSAHPPPTSPGPTSRWVSRLPVWSWRRCSASAISWPIPAPQAVEAGLAPTDGGATATVKVRF